MLEIASWINRYIDSRGWERIWQRVCIYVWISFIAVIVAVIVLEIVQRHSKKRKIWMGSATNFESGFCVFVSPYTPTQESGGVGIEFVLRYSMRSYLILINMQMSGKSIWHPAVRFWKTSFKIPTTSVTTATNTVLRRTVAQNRLNPLKTHYFLHLKYLKF